MGTQESHDRTVALYLASFSFVFRHQFFWALLQLICYKFPNEPSVTGTIPQTGPLQPYRHYINLTMGPCKTFPLVKRLKSSSFLSIQIKPNSLWGCNISEWFETNERPGRLLKWLVCLIQQSKQYPEQINKVYQSIIEHVCMALSPKLTLTYSTRSSAFMPSLSHRDIVA